MIIYPGTSVGSSMKTEPKLFERLKRKLGPINGVFSHAESRIVEILDEIKLNAAA